MKGIGFAVICEVVLKYWRELDWLFKIGFLEYFRTSLKKG